MNMMLELEQYGNNEARALLSKLHGSTNGEGEDEAVLLYMTLTTEGAKLKSCQKGCNKRTFLERALF